MEDVKNVHTNFILTVLNKAHTGRYNPWCADSLQ